MTNVAQDAAAVCNAGWIDLFKALLTPMIGVLTAYIAYSQWRTAESKLRLDLFEKRWGIYSATRGVILALIDGSITPTAAHRDFGRAMQGARWIFNEPVSIYMDGILALIGRYLLQMKRLGECDERDEERPMRETDRASEILSEIASQVSGSDSPLDQKLGAFLTITQPTLCGGNKNGLSKLHKK